MPDRSISFTHAPVMQISREGGLLASNKAGKIFFEENQNTGFITETIRNVFAGGLSGEFEFENKQRTWLFTYQVSDSGIVDLIGMDISARVVQWKEMQFRHDRNHFILQHLQAGILIISAQGIIEFANDAFCNLFDLVMKPEIIIGSNFQSFTDKLFTYFENPSSFKELIEQCKETNDLLFDHKLNTANGKIYKVDFIPFNTENAPGGNTWQFQDITALTRANEIFEIAEKQFRTCINQLNMGLLEVDLQGKVDYVNDSFCRLTGYEQEELLKKSAADILLTDSSVKRMQSIQENRTQGVGHTYELELKCKNGESRVFLISGVPKLDISGNICGSIGIHVAVSDPTSIKTKVGDHYKDVEEVKDPYHMLNINKLAEIKELTIDAMSLAESGLIAEDVYVLRSLIRNLQQSLKATYQIISR